MRGAVIAMLLAGCYRPSDPACAIACAPGPGACPSGLVCGAAALCEPANGPSCNALLDAGEDAVPVIDGEAIDGRLPLECNVASFLTASALINGDQYMTSTNHAIASYLNGNEVHVNTTAPDSGNTMDYVYAVGTPESSFEVYSGYIDPTGQLIYVTADDGMAMTESTLLVSRRDGNGWGTYEPLVFKVGASRMTIGPGAKLGASTDPVFGKRRIPMYFNPGGFDEYVEETAGDPTTYSYVAVIVSSNLGVTLMEEPSFTADGLRVVYIGQQASTIGIYVSSRASVTSPWGGTELLRVGSSSYGHPHLSVDCRHLYWTEQGVIYHSLNSQ